MLDFGEGYGGLPPRPERKKLEEIIEQMKVEIIKHFNLEEEEENSRIRMPEKQKLVDGDQSEVDYMSRLDKAQTAMTLNKPIIINGWPADHRDLIEGFFTWLHID